MASDLVRLQREVEDVIARILPGSMMKAPAGKWNAAQILEHLFLTYKNTNRGVQKCLDQGAPLATSVTLKQRIGTLLVVNLGYLPEGRTSPERAAPRGLPPEEVRSTILGEVQKMESGLGEAERRFGASAKLMDHPFLGPFTAAQWRKFHLVHGRHHMKQIRERCQL